MKINKFYAAYGIRHWVTPKDIFDSRPTYEEALEFANTEWAKIRRNNGHQVELKVIGDYQLKPGWIKIILYSYPTDMWMYIKSVSHEISESGEFNTNVTLVDYPPSLGEWNQTEEDETEEDTEAEE